MSKLSKSGIKAIVFTGHNEEEEKLWPRVDEGEFRVVYITPEALMESPGHFCSVTSRQPEFMERLIAVALDECDLIWDWEGFREKLAFIERLWRRLCRWNRVPFACLSASFTPRIANDTSEIYPHHKPTIDTTVSPRRNNVNIIVSHIEEPGIQPLLRLIPEGISDPLDIPKTIVFHDRIDPGIHIARRLRAHLPSEVAGIPSKSIVPCVFDCMDLKARTKALSDFREGRARILVCMDAWGLGIIDIPDIERVIQWRVDENLDFSDLNQRIELVARDQTMEGVAIIYVQKGILNSMSKKWKQEVVNWEEAWQRPDLFYEEYDLSDTNDEMDEEYDDDGRVKRHWKQRELGRFGLPVRVDTQDKVSTHVKHLYREAKTIRRVHRAAKEEGRRTGRSKMPSTKRLDPAVLWLLCTQGCRHRPFRFILKDPKLFEDKHFYWCCDNCAIADGKDIKTISSAVNILNSTPKLNVISPPEITRSGPISPERMERVRLRLTQVREFICQQLPFPYILPIMILSDYVRDELVKHLSQIVTVEQLCSQLEKAGIHVKSSLLSEENVREIMSTIDAAMVEPLEGFAEPGQ